MAHRWEVLDQVPTAEGLLELRRSGGSFLILVAGRVLMASAAHRSEALLATHGCAHVAGLTAPRVLIAGLGMGLTLRAALDLLPPGARVTVAEITPAVARWCEGPLSSLNRQALQDPRVTLRVTDVATLIAAAGARGAARFDAILLDLYEGPREAHGGEDAPFYGRAALAATHAALAPGGIVGFWSEDPDDAFERRLRRSGFSVEHRRPRGGPRHVVYFGTAARGARRHGAPNGSSPRPRGPRRANR